jgi:cytosol alanyl aminopeptidase
MRMMFVVLGLVACSSSAAPVKPSPVVAPVEPGHVDRGLEPPAPVLRLPRNFLPARYAATLAIDPALAGFDGTVAITGTITARSSLIWLHGHQLTVTRAVASQGDTQVALTATPHGEELLAFHAATPLAAGTWTLTITYTGSYDERNTSGVFKQTVAGAPYIYSQFEALYARRAFPCFDEPDNKVPWQLTLDVPAALVAVSNTPIAHEQVLPGGKKRIAFAVTQPLPSYLVAFGVGPFDIVDAGKTRSGTPIRILTMKDRAAEGAWAAKTTGPMLDLLEDLFGSPYPYAKIDMLAIPITVGFGAMENAGLITFTEAIMLIDPKQGSRGHEYTWITIAAHELAHQWFGDLVTTAWWDDIWLNEGFADWIERKISARFEPAWHEELAELSERNQALASDSLVSARQIRQPIATPDDILNAFDGITYKKGASVLNMFEGYVGPDVFQRGVREYLKQHAFGNATSRDFAAAISAAAGKDVGPAFATFLEQPGAPELTATLACDHGPPRLALTQRRYVPPGARPPAEGKPWIVPVCVAYDRGGKRAETCTLLDAATGSVALEAPSCPRWVMPNVNGRGYYRLAYTPADVAALRDRAWPQLTTAERQAVFFDTADGATLGKLPLALALSFLPRMIASGNREAIEAAIQLPLRLHDAVPDELQPRYRTWMAATFGPAARKAGLLPGPRDSLDVERARRALVDAAGSFGRDPVLAAQAVQLAARWHELPESMRNMVITIAAEVSPPVFERLRAELPAEPDRNRREDIIGALGLVSDVDRQRLALGLMLDPKVDIRETQWMVFLSRAEANRVAAQQFFQAHMADLLKRIPSEGTASGQANFAFIFTSSCSATRRDEIARYVTETFAKMDGGARVVQQAIEAMDQCIAQRALIEPEIRAWLGTPAATARRGR